MNEDINKNKLNNLENNNNLNFEEECLLIEKKIFNGNKKNYYICINKYYNNIRYRNY